MKDVYVGQLVSSNYLEHYGKGHDDNPPGRGSGRYPWGSGKNPKQHEEDLKNDIREHYRKNAKNANIEKGYQKRRFKTVGLDTSNPKYDLLKTGSTIQRYSSNNSETLDSRKYVWLTSADREAYKDAFLAGALGNKDKTKGAFRYELKAKKDIKIAKADEVEKYIVNKYADAGQKIMYDFLKEIDSANGYITTWRLNTSKDEYQKKMGEYVTKGRNVTQQFFNDHMMSNPGQMKDVMDHFYKLGYDAIVDPEDSIAGFSYPMILIKPEESVTIDKVHRVRPFKDST